MLIIFRPQSRNEAIIYSLNILSEQNARHAANIPVSLMFHLKKASCFTYVVKLFINPPSGSFKGTIFNLPPV